MQQTITFIFLSIGGSVGSYLADGEIKPAVMVGIAVFFGAAWSYFLFGKE